MRARGNSAPTGIVVLIVLSALLARPGITARADAPSGRPNILLIVSDDQTWSTFDRGLMPSVYSQLVDKGVLFTRAYVNTSLCCPSRSQIMTGLYEHHTGVDENDIPLSRPTIVQALQDSGYRTALAGKYLNSMPCDPRPEFDQWMCSGRRPSDYSLRDPLMNVNGTWTQFSGYTVQIQANFISSFIASTPADQPFFAMYTPTSPHLPANDDRYASLPIPPLRDPSYDQETRTSAEPLYMRRPPLGPDLAASIDQQHTVMSQAVRALDDSVATLLSSLGDREQNTLVFYLSDNGFLYGEHRWSTKVVPYEASVNVPFIVRYPALRPESEPMVSDAIVENVDIAPTIADLLGMPWGADGKSLVPLLTGSSSGVRDAALLEHCQGVNGSRQPCFGFYEGQAPQVPGFWGLVTDRYKYVGYATGERELYDLSADPSELTNLAGDPPHATVVRQLAGELAALRAPPPVDTTIVTGPSGALHGRVATFTYFSQSRFATYRCRLDEDGVPGAWHSCNGGSDAEGSLADGSYVFEVAGTDERGVSDPTPATRSFTVSSTGPDVEIHSAPPAHLAATSASFYFSSQTPGATFECELAPLAGAEPSWATCDPAAGAHYGPLADGWWSFEVRSIDPATGATSDPPAESLFHVDHAGPRMTFSGHPAPTTRAESASFSFFPNEATAGPYVCRTNGRAPVDCSGGRIFLSHLEAGLHRFSVTATDEIGNVHMTAFSWLVDRTPPAVRVERGPRPFSNDSTVTFRLRSTGVPAGFMCRLDGGALMMCPRAPVFAGLTDGRHTLMAIAADDALNTSQPVTWTWIQDTASPSITVSGGPSGLTSSASASFTLVGSEPGTFECSLDAAPFNVCTSPVSLSGLTDGPHTFAARERDLAGNSSEPVTVSWTVDTRPPTTTILSGPSDPTPETSATFTFSADEPGVAFSCSIDGGPAQPCASGVTVSGLSAGGHSFAVEATDAAGNVGVPATWTWTITMPGSSARAEARMLGWLRGWDSNPQPSD